MKEEIKEILDNLEKVKNGVGTFIGIDSKCANLLLDYITNLQQENERLKETNVYCNRTDCVGRIKDSKKYDSVYQEKEDYKSRIEKAFELLKRYTDNESNYYVPVFELIDILNGRSDE